MTDINDLLKQREDLDKQIEGLRRQKIASAVESVRKTIAEFDLQADDIFPKAGKKSEGREPKKVAPKYRDPATGDLWTGRGRAPVWIANVDRTPFLIQK